MQTHKIQNPVHLDLEDIKNESKNYDLIIVGVSVESRAAQSQDYLKSTKSECIKLALLQATMPINFFTNESEYLICKSVAEIEAEIVRINHQEPISICIDVSSIHRRCLAVIISILIRKFKNISLSFLYTIAKYSTPNSFDAMPNRRVEPVHPEFAGWASTPHLPIAAIIGLGYEKDKALGALEYIEPSERIIYIPNSPETEYRIQVSEHNNTVIKGTAADSLIDYDVDNPVSTFISLHSLVSGFKDHYRPILFPFGPKIFFAISLIVSISNSEVSIWYVSGEEDETLTDKKPSDKLCTFGFQCQLIT